MLLAQVRCVSDFADTEFADTEFFVSIA